MIIDAPCKINLGLDILCRRPDGYHDLQTVMFPVAGLCDRVELQPAGRTSFAATGLRIDCPDGDNLCLKACRLMQSRFGAGNVRMALDKRVPFGAGLGGGSSDATAVIVGMNELFGLGLCEEELIGAAAELGSDTAFFVRGTPQLCEGRGEVMTPFPLDLTGTLLVIVKPDVHVSTREAYAGVTPRVPEVPLAERLRRPRTEWQRCVTNDFEDSVFAKYPKIGEAKAALLREGAFYAAMSGSGSAVFGLFAGDTARERLRRFGPFVFAL